MKTDDLINELIGLKADVKTLRSSLRDKQKAWADAENLLLKIPVGGIHAGMWGYIPQISVTQCNESFPEQEGLSKAHERIEEIQEQLKYQPQVDAFAELVTKINCMSKTP